MKPAYKCQDCGRTMIVFESDQPFGEISFPCKRCGKWQHIDLRVEYTSDKLAKLRVTA